MATWAAICLDSHMRLLEVHMGHKGYRPLHETLGWPHGPQEVQIVTGDSWMAAWAARGIDSCRRLLGGHHMGRNRSR